MLLLRLIRTQKPPTLEERFWKRRTTGIAALCKYNLCRRLHLLSGGFSWKANVLRGQALPVCKSLDPPGGSRCGGFASGNTSKRGQMRVFGRQHIVSWDPTLLFVLAFGDACGVEYKSVVDARVTEILRRLPSTLRNRRRRRTAGIRSEVAGSPV
jgi:hypothetical protein